MKINIQRNIVIYLSKQCFPIFTFLSEIGSSILGVQINEYYYIIIYCLGKYKTFKIK